jgi:hypothetical protein
VLGQPLRMVAFCFNSSLLHAFLALDVHCTDQPIYGPLVLLTAALQLCACAATIVCLAVLPPIGKPVLALGCSFQPLTAFDREI